MTYGLKKFVNIEHFKKLPGKFLSFIQVLIISIFENGLTRLRWPKKTKFIYNREGHYRIILKAAMDGYWLTDLNGRILDVNDAYCRMSGYREEELVGMHVSDLEVLETAEHVGQRIQEMLKKGSDRFESRHRRKNGTVFDVEVSIQLQTELGGRFVCFLRDISDYRRLENKKNKIEKTHKSLLNNLNAGVIVHGPDTSIMVANQTACRLLGLSEEQLMGIGAVNDHWQFLRNDGSEMPTAEYPVNRVLSSKKELHNQIVGALRSGTNDVVWVLVNGFPVLKEDAVVEQVVISFVDITEMKQAQQSVVLTNEKMRLAAKSAHFGIWDLDVQNNRLEWDDGMFRLYGLNRDSFSGVYEAWQAGVHPDDLERSSQEVEQTLRGEKEFDTQFRIVRPDGQVRVMKAHAAVSRDNRGNALHMTGINYDITEKIKSEVALKESEERFRALHNASFGGIAIHDKGRILECNKGLSTITGYDYHELIGMDGLLLISDDTRHRVKRNIDTGHEMPYEATGVRKNGERYPIRLDARNIPYRGKRVRVVEFRDISEEKRSEKEREELQQSLRQAQKMEAVGRLAGGVAHDFNNMLSVIIGHAGLALLDVDQSSPLYDRFEEIRKAAERSADLTRQLLAFARKQTISPRVLDLNKTVEGMTRMLQRLIGEDIDLEWKPGKKVWPVKMDPGQVDQILANLCINARDAIADVGKITIETAAVVFDETCCPDHPGLIPGEYAMLAVSDNGCGMDPEILPNIFEPFFTTKVSDQGTGLGLSMIYGVVKQNNGFVDVYSEPDHGTSFKLYFPRHKIVSEDLMNKKTSFPIERGNETILIVEDEFSILAMTAQMLESLGYKTLKAQAPEEALHLAQTHKSEIHLLLTDVIMPEMNGRDLAENILSICPDLRCLFMSGYTANVIAHHGVLEDDVNFIQKPFSRKQLGTGVREALR
ncbi:PAS domain S-box-containing protein [Desulfocicer vacuolatum DSM 3385]|uniref:histidine kinase n=1 Tax=Desulfocicer vacuolatum DSM 3385 TaxID=1121400 RepID=A0A1W2E5M6_9BACT|nr:PAS domain-containing hybrid sensor histidine kinase/response regulator [Desulfocicer vacuolatum]SMD05089.1 PAS domain S-box-containing protein [Desulfocicer vacuolatum DSM 3385]